MIAASNLIDELIAEQQTLTAVERFSQKHASITRPTQERYYRDLIPIRKPDSGEQYAFEVDLDACTSCKACVTACHSQNGLADDESWRDVGVLYGGTVENPVQRTVTTACHHCADPACSNGCPVLAYEKDANTGIVRHLDDQCIGCKYCQLKCPYDVPKYNKDRGIVRKCDMCHGRLAEGEAPACVQACPNEAIKIRIVRTEDATEKAINEGELVPGAYQSTYTKPTTVFKTETPLQGLVEPADLRNIEPSEGHLPLVAMLVPTQAAAGVALFHLLAMLVLPGYAGWQAIAFPALGALLCAAGMGASVLHLGQPLKAWRAFLGWKRSWLSREIIALSGFMPMIAAAAGAVWLFGADSALTLLVAGATAGVGILAAFTSAMVYIDTGRAFWSPLLTGSRFAGTALVMAPASLSVFFPSPALVGICLAVLMAKLAVELIPLKAARNKLWDGRKKSALVQLGPLRNLLYSRIAIAIAGIIFLGVGIAPAGALLLLAGELLERSLFFRAVDTPKMPGVIKS